MPPEILLMLAKMIADKRRRSAARDAALAPQAGTADKVAGAAGSIAPQAGGAYLGNSLASGGSSSVATPNILGASRVVPSPSSVATPNLLGASRVVPPDAGFGNLGLENMGYGNFGSMGIGPQAGIVAGTALTAKGVKDLVDGKKSDPLTRGVTAMSTFGGSELARLAGFGNHKSTKERQSDYWGNLAEDNGTSDYWKDQAKGQLKVINDSIAGKHIGLNEDGTPEASDKEWNFGEELAAIKSGKRHNTSMFRGIKGNKEAFGGADEWEAYTDDQRDNIIQAAAKEGLLYSSKGSVDYTNYDKVRELRDQVLAGKYEGLSFDKPNGAVATSAGADTTSTRRAPSGGGKSRRGGGRRINLTNPFLNTPDPNIISDIIKTNVTSTPQFGHDVQSIYNDNEYFNPLEYRGIYG